MENITAAVIKKYLEKHNAQPRKPRTVKASDIWKFAKEQDPKFCRKSQRPNIIKKVIDKVLAAFNKDNETKYQFIYDIGPGASGIRKDKQMTLLAMAAVKHIPKGDDEKKQETQKVEKLPLSTVQTAQAVLSQQIHQPVHARENTEQQQILCERVQQQILQNQSVGHFQQQRSENQLPHDLPIHMDEPVRLQQTIYWQTLDSEDEEDDEEESTGLDYIHHNLQNWFQQLQQVGLEQQSYKQDWCFDNYRYTYKDIVTLLDHGAIHVNRGCYMEEEEELEDAEEFFDSLETSC